MGRIGEMMDRRREAENVVMHTHQVLSWEKIRFLPNKQTKSQKSENEASLPGVVPCNLGGKGKSGDIEVFCHHISSLNWHCIATTCLMYITQNLLVQYAAQIIKLFVQIRSHLFFVIVQGVPKKCTKRTKS